MFPIEVQDIYFREEYVQLYATDDQKACCFCYIENEKIYLFPLLLRDFVYRSNHYKDFETAYGYGGPIVNTKDLAFIYNAHIEFFNYCKNNNFIAGFVRFHPILENYKRFESIGSLIFDRETVAMNLNPSTEDIWKQQVQTKNRNVILKANKQGLSFIVDSTFSYLDDFVKIYYDTMDRLKADDSYYLNYEYFIKLRDTIKNSFIGGVIKNDNLISAAIFLNFGIYSHYHLSGSKEEYLSYSPNNYLLWEAAKELKLKGSHFFHLGGGSTSDSDDTLFKFKKKYSNNTLKFYIGKTIFNKDIYNEICLDWEINNPEKIDKYKNFILKYKY